MVNSKPNRNWREVIYRLLESQAFNIFTGSLILYSVITFCFETLPDLSEANRNFLYWSEIFVVSIFTIEYFLRIIASKKPLSFILSVYGLIDLLAILPFYLATSIDLRSLRVIRLMRLARLLKLVRYNQALKRFARALLIAREELILFILLSCMVIFLAAVGIYHFEHASQPEQFKSIFDSLWWAVATLTTVGYGDIYPITLGGRIFTFVILMVGLGLVAVPTGIISSALSSVRSSENP